MRKRKKLIIIIIIIVLGVGGFFYSKRNSGNAVNVREAEVYTDEVTKTVSASGVIKSINQANLATITPGTLEKLNVKETEEVKKGQILGNVSNYDLYKGSEAKKQARDIALIDRDLYVENYSTNLSAIGGEDEYNIGLRRHNELVAQAEDAYQASLGSLTDSYLIAPFDGTVVDVLIDQGELVTAGASVLTVADLNQIVFEASIDQEDFGLVKLNQEVEVQLDSFSNKTFTGTVYKLPLVVDSASNELTVLIKINDVSDNPVLIGMEGDADIVIEKNTVGGTALTFDAVFGEDSTHYVWLNEEGKLVKQPVEIGLEGDLYTIILSDIDFDKVVVPLDDEFEEGASVKLEE
ncbi:MAG: efflux RND transporter periplasmic adaptor subunit [Patescibacteria group bacterium]